MNLIKKCLNRIFVEGLSGMALGLFATLIIGTIIQQIGMLAGGSIGTLIYAVGKMAAGLTCAGIGVGVAYKFQESPMVVLSAATSGMIGGYASKVLAGTLLVDGNLALQGPGEPLGAFIAAYVGIEIGIPGTLNFYLADPTEKGAGLLANGAAIGGAIAAIYWLLMLVGRSASSVISGKVATRTQLIVVSATAICFILIAIFTPKEITVSMPGYSVENGFEMASVPVSALFLVLCGLCTSIMWGGIFNLAVEGLGKYTAQASGIFMMMVVGGGIFPLLQQFISDAVGYMASYWLIIALLAYLLFYGLVGCKNVNKDIPVE